MFHDAGANDTILLRNAGSQLQVDVAMAMHRSALLGQKSRQLVSKLAEDSDNRLFWPSVHRIYEGFPKLSASTIVSPEVGGTVGSNVLISKIGSGSIGEVYLSVNSGNGQQEAMKLVAKRRLCDCKRVQNIYNEFRALCKIEHPNVIALREVMHTTHYIVLVLDYSGKSNLYRHLKRIESQMDLYQAKNIFEQAIAGLAYLHGAGIAHRDLKPENITVSDEEEGIQPVLKIIDFGCAVPAGMMCKDPAGTMPFMAPEILLGESYDPKATDVWALGVVLLETLCGIGKLNKLLQWPESPAPKPTAQSGGQLKVYLSDPVSMKLDLQDKQLPDPLLELVTMMLTANAEERWSAQQSEACGWSA
jgi:serine/threonine protein kinase